MTRNTLIGINGVAKKCGRIYVGVGGIAKKVQKGYIGVNGLAKLFYSGDPILIFEEANAGTYNITLAAGRYEITLIGGGGGGVVMRSATTAQRNYAQGGVGGTLQFIANLANQSNISISVGAGGNTTSGIFSAAAAATAGTNGGATTITGWLNLSASAGGGTTGRITPTSSSACDRTPGVIGINSVGGTAAREVLMNNPVAIVSFQGTAASTSALRQPTGRNNDNWAENVVRGKSGDGGWNGNNFIHMIGAAGFVRIRML